MLLGWGRNLIHGVFGKYSDLEGAPQSCGRLHIATEQFATRKTNIGCLQYTNLALGDSFGSGAYVL